MPAKILGVGRRKKCALVMIEPPSHLGRVGILEIDDDVFVAVEQFVFPRLNCAVCHSSEMKLGIRVEALPIEAVEKCSGSGTVEAAVVEAQSNSGHERTFGAFLLDGGCRHSQSF
jgi:hypothetical protein